MSSEELEVAIEKIIIDTSMTITNVGMDAYALEQYVRGVAWNSARKIVNYINKSDVNHE